MLFQLSVQVSLVTTTGIRTIPNADSEKKAARGKAAKGNKQHGDSIIANLANTATVYIT